MASDNDRFRELIDSDNAPSEFKADPDRYVYRVPLQSNEYLEGEDGWKVTPNGDMEIASIFARGEVDALSFRARRMNAINGSLLITRSAVLKRAITPDDDEIIVSDNSFSIDDIIYVRLGTEPALLRRARRSTDKYEYMKVTSIPQYYEDEETEKTWWKYSVERAYGEPDEVPKYWQRGATLVVWVDANTGAILLAADREHSPYIDILERDSTQINAIQTRVRLGRLSGISDTVLNPSGFGLYTDNCFLRGRLAIGGLQGSNTAIEIFDTTGNRRGLITNTGEGWLGSYHDFRWDVAGTVFIRNLELDNIILVGGGLDATGGVITAIGLQEGLYIQSNTRQFHQMVRWDTTQFTVVNEQLEDVLAFISSGELRIGRQNAGVWSDGTRGIMQIADGVRIKEGHVRNIIMQRDATIKSSLHVDGPIFGTLADEPVVTESQDFKIHKDLVVQDDATIKNDIYVEDERIGGFGVTQGVTTDFTSGIVRFDVVKGLIINIRDIG